MARKSPDLNTAFDTLIYHRLSEVLPSAYRLSPKGFLAIGAASLCRIWSDIDMVTAVKWFADYMQMAGMKFGDTDYDWTVGGARDLAQCLADDSV